MYDCHGRNVGLLLHLRAQNIEENGVGAFSFFAFPMSLVF
jgi:hypothetical protein